MLRVETMQYCIHHSCNVRYGLHWGHAPLKTQHLLLMILINPLASGRCGCNFKNIIFELISWINTLSTSRKIVVRWMPQNSAVDKSTLVQLMAWCRQATNHYLSRCWPKSMSPNGITRTQRVNSTCRCWKTMFGKPSICLRNSTDSASACWTLNSLTISRAPKSCSKTTTSSKSEWCGHQSSNWTMRVIEYWSEYVVPTDSIIMLVSTEWRWWWS